MTASEERASCDVAVVDVGSNSVRLVLYRLEGRAIWQVYNEKVLAGLGRNLAQTGRLAAEGVVAAMAALRRFRAVLDGAAPTQVFCAATAAVREAADGRVFVDRVRAETGLVIRVLSGEEEAHYSALGVIAGQPKAEGVVGDLGGSSLELVRIADGQPGAGATLPLGPFALGAPGPIEAAALGRLIRARLAQAAPTYSAVCLHAVGGAWRNIALIHMDATRYPLRIVHQYEMTGRDALEAARFVAQQSRASLERMPGVTRKRAETLPYAAMVLEAMVETLGFERISFSAFGLREGLLLDAIPADVRGRDPLVEGCAAIGVRQGAAEHLGRVLQPWLEPMWASLPPLFEAGRDGVLMAAACRLADMGARLHPDHRADLAFDQVLRAPTPGQTHTERAYLAAAVFARFTAAPPADAWLERLLSPERVRRARALGAAMRLGCDLSGRSANLLFQSRLALDGRGLLLSVQKAAQDLTLGEQTKKRLASVAGVLQVDHRIEVV